MEPEKSIIKHLSKEEQVFFSFLKNPVDPSYFKSATLDEKIIIELIERHRLIPFFFENKEALSPQLKKYVAHRFLQNSQRMLLFANEIFAINELCEKKNVKPIFLKGPLLAYELNNDLASRQMVDLDIYVDRTDLTKVNDILLNLGFKPTEIPKTRFKKFILKDNYYFHPEKKISVEIHYRFFPNKFLDTKFKVMFPYLKKELQIQNKKMPVLNDGANIIFLILHGANHQWFRLFWLKDVADFITKKEINWENIFDYSKKLGIKSTLKQSVTLINLFFGVVIPKEFRSLNRNKKIENFLVSKASKVIISPINASFFTRIKRLNYLLKISTKIDYKWNTFAGGLLRYLGKKNP